MLVACSSIALNSSEESPATPTNPKDTETNSGTDIAPSFEEIQETMNRIVGDKRPINEEQRQELYQYLNYLDGKKVENWTGWVQAVSPDEDVVRDWEVENGRDWDAELRMYVFMDNPYNKPPGYGRTPVLLGDLTVKQAQQFKAWGDMQYRNGSWQKVRFSGALSAHYPFDLIPILVSEIEPID